MGLGPFFTSLPMLSIKSEASDIQANEAVVGTRCRLTIASPVGQTPQPHLVTFS
jgi:hypothetical protein